MEIFDMPEEVDITPEEAKGLRRLEDRVKALGQFIQTLIQQGEAQTGAYQKDAIETWNELSKKYHLDIINVVYTPHPIENKLVPIQVKRSPESNPFGTIPGK